jgi:glycerophosphoryl diester phosphodiesterase
MPASIWSGTSAHTILVGAHRGASAVAPENSAEAFEAAIAAGADFIETDLRLSRDGVPVAFHDQDLKRLCGDERAIADLDMAELLDLHPGIVRMAEALDLIGERASILLDTKLYERAALARCIELLTPRMRAGRIAFGVRSIAAFDIVHELLPDCPMLGLFADIGDYPELAARGGQWARLWEKDATPDNIDRLRAAGLKTVIMTGQPSDGSVGLIDAPTLAKLCAERPDAVMLNDAALAVEIIAQTSQPN